MYESTWLTVRLAACVYAAELHEASLELPDVSDLVSESVEALFSSSTGGKRYLGQLYKTGNHTIQVFLNRAAAGRGDTLDYKMVVRVTDKQPTEKEAMEDEEVPSTAAVPQKVIDDCLAALRKQIPDRDMEVISATRGETSFIIDVKVEGVPKPWRCFEVYCCG